MPGGVDAREQSVDAAQLVRVAALHQRAVVLTAGTAEERLGEGGALALAPLGAVAEEVVLKTLCDGLLRGIVGGTISWY